MDNNLLSPIQLSSYLKPTTLSPGPLLSPIQLSTYASKANPANPTSDVGSSWDSFDQAMKPPTPAPSGLINDLKPEVTAGINQIQKGGEQISQGTQEGGIGGVMKASEGVLSGTAGALRTAFSPITVAFNAITGNKFSDAMSAIQKDLESGQNKGLLGTLVNKVSDSPAFQKFATDNPDAAEVFNNLVTVGSSFIGGAKAPEITSALKDTAGVVKDTAGNIIDTAKNMFPEAKTPVLNESSIIDKYNRSIKPSVTGKANATQIAQSNSRVISGIRSIAENKANLQFTDAEGNVISGETPKTVDQMSQSIQQTKASIFKQYDSLAKQAGDKGITVDAPSIGKELQPVIDSKSLAIANPKAVAYAKDTQFRLNETGPVDAQTAQDVIKHYNDSLKAFYRNPNYETASQSGIDAMVANKFREKLDERVTGVTGEQYQTLKNQYGALSSMEKDVARRAQTFSKQSKIGFMGGIGDIASGAELVRGLLTLNPVDIAISGTIKGIQLWEKHMNNPDVGVAKIFDEVNKISPSSTTIIPPTSSELPQDEASSNSITKSKKSKK